MPRPREYLVGKTNSDSTPFMVAKLGATCCIFVRARLRLSPPLFAQKCVCECDTADSLYEPLGGAAAVSTIHNVRVETVESENTTYMCEAVPY